MTTTKPVWQTGDLIASESLEMRLQSDPQKWGSRVCIVLGNSFPLLVPFTTKIQQIIQSHIQTLNENYLKALRSEPVPLPSTSFFSMSEPKELMHLLITQAVQAQQLPWIKASLLPPSEIKEQIKKKTIDRQTECTHCLYQLLEEGGKLCVKNHCLSLLKSFLLSQICFYEFKSKKTLALTWDMALALWVKEHGITKARVGSLSEALKKISSLEEVSGEESTLFEPCIDLGNPSFRSFVAAKSCDYIATALSIPQEFVKKLSPLFEQYELARLLVLHYCQTLDHFKTKCANVDNFFKCFDEQGSKLKEILVNDIEHSDTLEVFCESASLYTATILLGSTTPNTPSWHPMNILLATSKVSRTTLTAKFSLWQNIAKAALCLAQLESTYKFEIPDKEKFDFALAYSKKSLENSNLSQIITSYSSFSLHFQDKAPLERIKLLLDFNLTLPLLAQYLPKEGSISSNERLYLEAVRNICLDNKLLPCIEEVLKELQTPLTFDEIITLCKWGPKKYLSYFLLNNYPTVTSTIKVVIERLKKYHFSNYQKVFVAIQYIYSKIQHTPSIINQQNRPTDVELHIDMLSSIEETLNLPLPQKIAFSWLVHHEIKKRELDEMIKTLKKARAEDCLDQEAINSCNEALTSLFSESRALDPIPGTDPLYKTAIRQFLERTIHYNVLQYEEQSPLFFYPKILPYPPKSTIFSHAAPNPLYQNHHMAFFASWNESETENDRYEYSLYMVKSPYILETSSSVFTLKIPKTTFESCSLEEGFKYTFFRILLHFFVSKVSLTTEYSEVVKELQKHPKLELDPVMNAALSEYPLYGSEGRALFSFANQLHRFVRRTCVRFATPARETTTNKPFLELASQGSVYDEGEFLSLLDSAHKKHFSQLAPSFTISKTAITFDVKTGTFTKKEAFYENDQEVVKEVVFELAVSKQSLNVTIALKQESLFLHMKYSLQEKNLLWLIAWQTLLLKSKFYKAALEKVALTNNLSKLKIKE
jgi:hypothetical protein